MAGEFNITWDPMTCRAIINRLRDGLPPPVQAVDFLSVGAESHLSRIRRGLQCAAQGGFDSTILVGRYGIGKSHLLRRVQVLAEAEHFTASYVEIGSGGVYFNSPQAIAEQLAGSDWRNRLPEGRGYYTDRKFIDQLNFLAETVARNTRSKRGLVILLDEMENSFDWSNLPQLRSRIKAYRYLNTLFTGQSDNPQHRRRLQHIYVVLAITPGVIEGAVAEESGYYQGDNWVENPAHKWARGALPDQLQIEPLSASQATQLLRRIRAIHARAFGWHAGNHVSDDLLSQLVTHWVTQGAMRDERQLVKMVVELLEVIEQHL